MNKLLELIRYGQSYWLDNLSREMLENGELRHRVEKEGLRGITSNPAIFQKAISGSNLYDAQIKTLAQAGKKAEPIVEELMIEDIRGGCDTLRPVFDQSEGLDGYVSLEVNPHLARDSQRTLEEARRLFKTVGRPNLFIKIPGTAEGLKAIEEALFEGVNVNITLLFSVQRYEEVAKAYVRALERRKAKGLPVRGVASVASFFLSRIDVMLDKVLQTKGEAGRPLLGKIAVANAKLAYQSYKKIFSGTGWTALASEGARVQRLLWASTSTKNPDYSDVMYVDPLIGKDTVNTMPEETIAAFRDHGTLVADAIEKDVETSRRQLAQLPSLGIDLEKACEELEAEGIQKFNDPFDKLLASLRAKREQLLKPQLV